MIIIIFETPPLQQVPKQIVPSHHVVSGYRKIDSRLIFLEEVIIL